MITKVVFSSVNKCCEISSLEFTVLTLVDYVSELRRVACGHVATSEHLTPCKQQDFVPIATQLHAANAKDGLTVKAHPGGGSVLLGFKFVASAILADVEPWLPARRERRGDWECVVKASRSSDADTFSGREDAALYGRPGGPPLPAEHRAGFGMFEASSNGSKPAQLAHIRAALRILLRSLSSMSFSIWRDTSLSDTVAIPPVPSADYFPNHHCACVYIMASTLYGSLNRFVPTIYPIIS